MKEFPSDLLLSIAGVTSVHVSAHSLTQQAADCVHLPSIKPVRYSPQQQVSGAVHECCESTKMGRVNEVGVGGGEGDTIM